MSEFKPDPQLLRCSNLKWFDPRVKELLAKAPEELVQDELLTVVRELDRRLMQLMDKVTFERDHTLVDY